MNPPGGSNECEAITNEQMIKGLVHMVNTGEVSVPMADKLLDARSIHGGFNGNEFTGYDYRAQKWMIHRP